MQLACAAAGGFAILDGNSISYLSKPIAQKDMPHTRFNDGGCDRNGRFFAGTLYNEEKGIPGKLYRYDPATESCEVVDEGPFTVGLEHSNTHSSLTLRAVGLQWPRLESRREDLVIIDGFLSEKN